jgi:hypothetical protein
MTTTTENPNILRTLSRIEGIFDEEIKHRNMILPRIFLVDIANVDLDLELVKRACVYWVRRHPFLRAEIQRNDEQRVKHFVSLDESVAFAFNNVKMFTASAWEPIVDDDLAEPFELSHTPLWTLKVVKLTEQPASTNYNYAFVFKTQHSITDGRNAYEVFRQYLNILGALIENRICAEMDSSVVEHSAFTIEEMAYKICSKEKAMAIGMEKKNTLDRENRITSAFIDPSAEPQDKFQHFYLSSETQKQLFAKLKSNAKNAKLTGVVSTIVCLALKNLYTKHGAADIPVGKFQFSLMGSLREKLGVSNTQMGMYITQYERLLDDSDNSLSLSSVWSKAEAESLDLHRTIEANSEVGMVIFMDQMFDMIMSNPDMAYTDAKFNFKISNIGLMKNTDAESVRIRHCYVRTSNVHGRPGSNMLIGLAGVDGNLCFAFSYNEKMISSSVVGELIAEIKRIVDELIRN